MKPFVIFAPHQLEVSLSTLKVSLNISNMEYRIEIDSSTKCQTNTLLYSSSCCYLLRAVGVLTTSAVLHHRLPSNQPTYLTYVVYRIHVALGTMCWVLWAAFLAMYICLIPIEDLYFFLYAQCDSDSKDFHPFPIFSAVGMNPFFLWFPDADWLRQIRFNLP